MKLSSFKFFLIFFFLSICLYFSLEDQQQQEIGGEILTNEEVTPLNPPLTEKNEENKEQKKIKIKRTKRGTKDWDKLSENELEKEKSNTSLIRDIQVFITYL